MVWAGLRKPNEPVRFVGFKRARPRESALRYIDCHNVIALTETEVVNHSVHGISSLLGLTFALGGTIVNTLMVTFVVPIWCRLTRLESRL